MDTVRVIAMAAFTGFSFWLAWRLSEGFFSVNPMERITSIVLGKYDFPRPAPPPNNIPATGKLVLWRDETDGQLHGLDDAGQRYILVPENGKKGT